MRRHLPAPAVLLTAVLLTAGLASCADDSATPSGDRSSPRPTGAGTTPTDPASEPADPGAGSPSQVLDWERVPGPTSTTVTAGGDWTLARTRRSATLDGPDTVRVPAPARHRISHTLLDDRYAVVVAEDELAERPDTATVVELASGEQFRVDGGSDVPTTTGGTWALGEGRLLHATVDGGAYCLAEVDLGDRTSETRWCAPRRHGFSDARITADGTTLLTFDDGRPSCRTVVRLEGEAVTPFADAPDCTGWDGLLTGAAGGVAEVWSVVPNARRVEEATFHAVIDGAVEDLGPGTSGTLTRCGEAAYFVRDPQRSTDPARLMAWSPTEGLRVAYETQARGRAFLSEPRCGDDRLTITAFSDSGDEQVTARVR